MRKIGRIKKAIVGITTLNLIHFCLGYLKSWFYTVPCALYAALQTQAEKVALLHLKAFKFKTAVMSKIRK